MTVLAPLPPALLREPNLTVLQSIAGRSAHSDIVEPLRAAVRDLPGVECFTPNGRAFRYHIAFVGHAVFALVDGMIGPTLRLPPALAEAQIARGGVARPEYGIEWVMLPLYAGLPTDFVAALPALARTAYDYALMVDA